MKVTRRGRTVAVVVGTGAAVLGVVGLAQVLGGAEPWDAADRAATDGVDGFREVDGPPDHDCLEGEGSYGIVCQFDTGRRAVAPPLGDELHVVDVGVDLTLGRDEPYAALDGARPDYVWVSGEDGVPGYVSRHDLGRIEAFAGRLSLYAEDASTVVGTYVAPSPVAYPVNESGQTYGAPADAFDPGAPAPPDLVEVLGDDCVEGYVPAEVLEPDSLATSYAARDEPERWFQVDVTESDGVTVVDTFTISGTVRP